MPDKPKPMPEGWLPANERGKVWNQVAVEAGYGVTHPGNGFCKCPVHKILYHMAAADQRIAELEKAIRAKLKDCRENGDCSDAALILDECCSNECAALAAALGGGAEEEKNSNTN